MRLLRPASPTGFTLLELLIVLTLLGTVLVKVVLLISETDVAMDSGSAKLRIESQARAVVDRIALNLMGADREDLAPILSPEHSSGLDYQVCLGVEDGAVVWDDPEQITYDAQGTVRWRQNPGLANELSVVWSHDVLPLIEGEELNGVDDNGNGLVDEEGLNFVVEGNVVTIRLSLGVTTENGERVDRSIETWVTVRNNPLQ